MAFTQPALPVWLDTAGQNSLIGRAAEKREIDDAWDAVATGRRHVVLVAGPPGVGKSRLVAEVATATHRSGAVVLHGPSHADYDRPFQPFAAMLDQLLDTDDEGVAFVEQGRRLQRFLTTGSEADTAPGLGRRALFESYARLLGSVAALAPVVLVLDDIHWGSLPTLDLLTHVVRATATQRLLVLATFRSTHPERTEEVTRTMADIYREPGVIRLDLAGLSTSEIRSFLTDRTGRTAAEVAAAATVLHDWTGGNPFYLAEVWRSALTGGDRAPERPPGSVGDAVLRRLYPLGPETRRLVTTAAFSNEGVGATTLATVGGADAAAAEEALDAAVASGVMAVHTGTFHFVHDLARQALIHETAPSEALRIHARYAEYLERHHGEQPGHAARIAHHYAATGRHPAKTTEFATRAGAIAEAVVAYEEASDHFEMAAEHAAADDDREELLLRAAGNAVRAAAFDRAFRLYDAVSSSGDPTRRARAAIGYADAMWRPGRFGHETVVKLVGAIEHLPDDADPALRVELRATLGRALGYAGEHDSAEEIARTVIPQARELGDDRLLATALIAPSYTSPEVSGALMARVLEASDLVATLDDPDMSAQTAFVRGATSYVLGRYDGWIEATATLARLADETGQPLHRVGVINPTAALALCQGDYGEAQRLVDSMLDQVGEFASDPIEGLHGSSTFMVKRETGLDDIKPLITGDPATEVGTWPIGLLAVYTELGLTTPALAVLERLMTTHHAADAAGRFDGANAAYLAEAVSLLRHRRFADALYEILKDRTGTNLLQGHFISVFGSADRYLGMLAAVLGRSARDHFETAVEMDRRMRSTHHQMETAARYALYLRTIDTDRSDALAAEAMAVAARSGNVRIPRLLATGAAGTGPLTPRELEVLELVGRGYSNRAISTELFISLNTAANHVRNILIKTGCSNRTQAARFAADRGLFD